VACVKQREIINGVTFFGGKPERMRSLGKLKGGYETNIKIDSNKRNMMF
jgi:hypothetical protein